MDIAYCCDRSMRVPLRVSVKSLLKHLSCAANLYFMTDFTMEERQDLIRSIPIEHDVTFLSPCDGYFEGLPSLHGSMAVYSRLLLPEIIPEDKILYIDADTLIQEDLSPLYSTDLGAAPLGAVVNGKMTQSLDAPLRFRLGHAYDAKAFNSGVLLFNAKSWRKEELLDRCVKFGIENKDDIQVVDQTILNCVFNGQVENLPAKYNSRERDAAILHFIGSPKPWDIGGRWLAPNADLWYEALKETGLKNRGSVSRAVRIAGGYRRALKKKFTEVRA